MSDEEKKESLASHSERHYMRLSNLPWSASHHDIQKFFKDIRIPEGGISIHKRDVFIVFLRNRDLVEALKKNGCILHGSKICLSTLEKSDFYRLRHRNVRRILYFSRTLRGGSTLRRIHPTFQVSNNTDMFSVFNPEEHELKCSARRYNKETAVKRKIKPTQIDRVSSYDGFYFEDRYSFE